MRSDDGHRFNRNKVLIDPVRARATRTALWERGAACGPDDNLASSMRSVVIDPEDYDWEGDKPLNRPMSRDGRSTRCTSAASRRSPSSGRQASGHVRGGDREDSVLEVARRHGRRAAAGLRVRRHRSAAQPSPMTASRCATTGATAPSASSRPHSAYCAVAARGHARHRVPRHGEGAAPGRHRSDSRRRVQPHERRQRARPDDQLQGLENSVYYHLVPSDRQYYMDYSGCGNTVNGNHPDRRRR